MRNAETVLAIIYERGKRGLPVEDLYRQLYNPDLYLRAYARIYANKGSMSKGATAETADGMSVKKITAIIAALRQETYHWTPVRRVYIPKPNGDTRPLGVPTWSNKLLQEVLRLLLEAYFEPQFSSFSHGFRPHRGCHTALQQMKHQWAGTKWFIEGDIKGCFDTIDHQLLLHILAQKIHDGRFLRLIQGLLKAGYLENWKYHKTFSGTPQGGIISPILANIYLDQLDTFIETALLPLHNRKPKRRKNPKYTRLSSRVSRLLKRGDTHTAALLRKQMLQLPSNDPNDKEYRRLRYIRYADDFVLGFIGPRTEAEVIKENLATFLQDKLRLTLSHEKTLITHAQTQVAHFLGYEIAIHQVNDRLVKAKSVKTRTLNGKVELRVPKAVISEQCRAYMKKGKPIHRPEFLFESDFAITEKYQWKYRGVMQYYAYAENIAWLHHLYFILQTSLLKTLAHKHKSSVAKMARKYQAKVTTPFGEMKCLEVCIPREGKKPLVARFGGIPWRRQDSPSIADIPTHPVIIPRNEIIKRLLNDTCELCGSTDNISVHHIRGLKDLQMKGRRKKPIWVQVMAAMQRKTLVVCGYCHWAIATGKPTRMSVYGT